MACKILFFEYKDCDKPYFDRNPLDNFRIKFFKESLNEETLCNLTEEDFMNANGISISGNSNITRKVIESFKNLRVIATRTDNFRHIDLRACVEKNIAVVNVDTYKPDIEFYNINVTFRGITQVLCGSKDYRVV